MSENFERVPVVILEDDHAIAQQVAGWIATLIRARNAEKRPTVLGLATGNSPLGIYRELIRMHREEGLDFSRVITFNLDEYYPMLPDSIHSYHRFMWENLFDHINITPRNVHLPRGDLPREEAVRECSAYEEKIRAVGGIDFQLLGIGQSGHIGFNEPGSGHHSRTRLITLDSMTRRSAAADFFGEENVPQEAITMGVATILEAREVALVAIGEHKAAIVRRSVEGETSSTVAATYLQNHPHATVYLDTAAAALLTRVHTPWVLGEVEWTPELVVKAVTWLSGVTNKSVLRLDAHDYREHHLGSLVAKYGSVPVLNGEVFNQLISKVRGKSKLPRHKRIIVFSPHPDDDVISAGGLLRKLQENENEILVAYQTSGNIAVFDHAVRYHVDFLRRLAVTFGSSDVNAGMLEEVEAFLKCKQPGEVDSPTVQQIKRIIREAEAVSGIETLGLQHEQARFLNLPFYQTGEVRKAPISEADVEIVRTLLEACRPEIILVAGDLSDPHGTHRMCLSAVEQALARYGSEPPEVWYYRGAWQEWPIHEADVLVPLSEEELQTKILAIFKHQSQKDKAPFPGLDEREFWQRVEARNKGTADEVDRLGLPAYYAMEAYVVRQRNQPLPTEIVATASLAG